LACLGLVSRPSGRLLSFYFCALLVCWGRGCVVMLDTQTSRSFLSWISIWPPRFLGGLTIITIFICFASRRRMDLAYIPRRLNFACFTFGSVLVFVPGFSVVFFTFVGVGIRIKYIRWRFCYYRYKEDICSVGED